jgi:lipoprotein NlpI
MNGGMLTSSRANVAANHSLFARRPLGGRVAQAAAALLFLLPFAVPLRAQTSVSASLDKCIMDVNGNPDEVLQACTAAIQSGILSETNRRAAYNDRGIAYRNKDDFDSAIADFNSALAINPNDDKVLNNRGAAYMYKGDNDRAIQDYDRAIMLNPDYFIAIKNRGAAYVNKGDYDRALKDYDRALELNPQHPFALQTRGILHFFMGDFAGALQDETSAMQADPTDGYSVIWLYLAQSRSGIKGQSQLADNSANLQLTKWPGPVIQVYLGKANPEGLVALGKASNPKYAVDRTCEANFYLGERALLNGSKDEARREFQAAVATGAKTNFEYRGAQVELERLGALK